GLHRAIGRMAEWSPPGSPDAARTGPIWRLLAHYLDYLFDWVAELLSQTEPTWLRAHAEPMERALARLREGAAAHPDASRLLADWFLHTHGLRAQRSALAQGTEPRVTLLRDHLQALRRIEDALLGDVAGTASGDRPDDRRQASAPAPARPMAGRCGEEQ